MTPLSASALNKIAGHVESFCLAAPGRTMEWSMLSDPTTRVGHGGDRAMPAASVAKVAVAMAVVDKIERGELDPLTRTLVRNLPDTQYCSVLKAFDADASLSVTEICRLALITSDNPLAVHLMDLVTLAEIRLTMDRAGLSDRSQIVAGFSDPELGPPNRANVFTASDCNTMFRFLATHDKYRGVRTALENNLRNARMPRLLPDTALVAHKTGSLAGVVNDVGIVSDKGRAFAIAFLCDQQADAWQTENEISKCAAAIYDVVMG